jgi:predicted DsbA family dithiol-disulfide isomerase
MKIHFVSDVACPWCAVGLHGLERALETLGSSIPVELHFEPFELNPGMAAGGEDTLAYLSAKYGIGPEQMARNQATIRERGAAVGFAFGQRHRVWNTFDAHRLLMWAGEQGADHQRRLKHALLQAYHGDGRNPGDAAVLQELAVAAGLDGAEAAAVLASNRYADAVRQRERHWQELGIHSVPSVIVNERHLIQGGQAPEVFVQALRQIAAEAA